jgi:hypothetical protein
MPMGVSESIGKICVASIEERGQNQVVLTAQL